MDGSEGTIDGEDGVPGADLVVIQVELVEVVEALGRDPLQGVLYDRCDVHHMIFEKTTC